MSWQKIDKVVRWLLLAPCVYYASGYYLGLMWFGDPTVRGVVLAVSLTFAAAVMSEALSSNIGLRNVSLVAALGGLAAIPIPDGHSGSDRLLEMSLTAICLAHFLLRVYLYGWRRRGKAG